MENISGRDLLGSPTISRRFSPKESRRDVCFEYFCSSIVPPNARLQCSYLLCQELNCIGFSLFFTRVLVTRQDAEGRQYMQIQWESPRLILGPGCFTMHEADFLHLRICQLLFHSYISKVMLANIFYQPHWHKSHSIKPEHCFRASILTLILTFFKKSYLNTWCCTKLLWPAPGQNASLTVPGM